MADKFGTRELIVNFAKDNDDVEVLQFIRDDPDGIHFKLFEGHGVINYVYRVQSADNKASVILKYAEETARCLPGEKVSLERQDLEYDCLKLMHDIQPGSVPEPYCLDKKHHICREMFSQQEPGIMHWLKLLVAMADMSDWDLLGTQLEKRYVDLEAAFDLGQLLGKVHMETSKGNVTEERWKEFQTKFDRPEEKEFIRLFTIDRMYDETDPLNRIDEENLEAYREYVKEIENLKIPEIFNEIYKRNICFIHGDCHYKAIFAKDGHVAVFDFEFSFLGHPAYNVALALACYIMIYIFDDQHVTDEQLATGLSRDGYKTACLNAIKNIVRGYLSAERDISKTEDSKANFLSTLTLFTGCCVFMLAAFAQMDVILEGLDHVDRRKLMDAGFRMMKDYEKVKTIDEFDNVMSLSN